LDALHDLFEEDLSLPFALFDIDFLAFGFEAVFLLSSAEDFSSIEYIVFSSLSVRSLHSQIGRPFNPFLMMQILSGLITS